MANTNEAKPLSAESMKEALAELAKMKDGGTVILEGEVLYLEVVPGNRYEHLAYEAIAREDKRHG